MRILHVYKDYYPVLGGIENHLKLLAEEQVRQGYEVTVLVTHPTHQTQMKTIQGVRVIFAARLATIASTPLSLDLLRQLYRQRPDIIHLHFPYPLSDVANLIAGRSQRMIISYHSDIVRQKRILRFYAPLLRYTLARADRIIATSPHYVNTSLFLAPHAAKCAIIPYGIKLDHFAHADPDHIAHIRAQFGTPLILFVGNFRYYKGIEYVIRAMKQTPGHLVLIGSETTTRQAELVQCAYESGVIERVHFVGSRQEEELPAFYHAANLFVLPSIERSEAFGIVQLEAQAAGLPIVCTELGTGTSYVTQHGITGFVVPPADPTILSQTMRILLENPDLAHQFGMAGQVRAYHEFSHMRMVERIGHIYQELL